MTMTIGGTSGLVFPDSSTQNTAATGFGFKNRILNGSMVLDQRNAGASVSTTDITQNIYTLDRWYYRNLVASKYTIQQNAGSVTPPVGFTNYLGCTSTSAYTVGSGDFFSVSQIIEGYNIADLQWGTANAKTVTLSFQVYSSLTGTFGGSILNGAVNRSYPFTYTISSANTWTPISITIAGDTTGTWLNTNGSGMLIRFSLGAGSTYSGTAGSWSGNTYCSATGSTNVVSTNGATWYVTGVQLEKGSTATSFDYRPYGTELALCQRYYSTVSTYGYYLGIPAGSGNNSRWGSVMLPVTMRSSPTLTFTADSGVGGNSADNRTVIISVDAGNTTTAKSFTSLTASAEL